MNDINNITLTGRITREPEIKYTASGMAVLAFGIASNYGKKQGDTWVDEVSFFDCAYFGKGAEAVKPYMHKGQAVTIQGELRQDRWEQDGSKREKVRIIVQNLHLPPKEGQGSTQGAQGVKLPQAQQAGAVAAFDDDIPF